MSDVSLGQAHETELRLRNAGATLENFWDPIAKSESLAQRVVAFMAEALKLVFKLISNIDRNMEGWKCVESVDAAEGEFEPVLQEFLRNKESFVNGEEIIRRAKEQGVSSGIRHAEAMLRQQDKIPVEWRKYYLVFPEVWQGPRGDRGVFCLCWSGGRWYLRCHWLWRGFRSSARLVASRKLSS